MKRFSIYLALISLIVSLEAFSLDRKGGEKCTNLAARYASVAFGIAEWNPRLMEEFLKERSEFFKEKGGSVVCLSMLSRNILRGELNEAYKTVNHEENSEEVLKEIGNRIYDLSTVLPKASHGDFEDYYALAGVKEALRREEIFGNSDFKHLVFGLMEVLFKESETSFDITKVINAETQIEEMVTEYYFTLKFVGAYGMPDFMWEPSIKQFKKRVVEVISENPDSKSYLPDSYLFELPLERLKSMPSGRFMKELLLSAQIPMGFQYDFFEILSVEDDEDVKVVVSQAQVSTDNDKFSSRDVLRLRRTDLGWRVDMTEEFQKFMESLPKNH